MTGTMMTSNNVAYLLGVFTLVTVSASVGGMVLEVVENV